MGRAAPRKNVKGETAIRPYRIGTSSGTRAAAWLSRRVIGSGRWAAGVNSAWLDRGTSARAVFPRAALSSRVGCGFSPVRRVLRPRRAVT